MLALVQAGADVNAKDRVGRTILYFAAWKSNLAIVDILIQAGADIKAHNKDGSIHFIK